MSGALVEPLTVSPLRSLLRHRFSSRVDRALVFLSPSGDDRVVHPRGVRACPYREPTLTMVGRRAFDRVSWVRMAEHSAPMEFACPDSGGWPQPPSQGTATWWVSEPVTVARRGLSAGDVPAWIAQDVARRAELGASGPGMSVQDPETFPVRAGEPDGRGGEPAVADAEWHVPEVGIAYRLHPRPPSPSSRTPPGSAMPSTWDAEERAAFRFYREVVAQGPHGLAALWLLRHPDEARDVLNWAVEHRNLLTDEAAWEHSLAALLQGLSASDRAFIGVNVATLLSTMGIPQADEVLDRVGGDGRSHRLRKGGGEPT